jgi:hypothetical protein
MDDIQEWSGPNSYGFMTVYVIRFAAEVHQINFQPTAVQVHNWHTLTPMSHQDPASHFSMNQRTHMEDIQWS